MFSRQPSLAFCIIMDLIGCATYIIPFFGEFFDIVWAPVSGLLFFISFRQWQGALINFLEEAIPGTDIIPTFTIMWFIQQDRRRKMMPPRR
ncbi:MAG: hypothetical protein ABW019_17690 [Chitinophagaceae bacterium]